MFWCNPVVAGVTRSGFMQSLSLTSDEEISYKRHNNIPNFGMSFVEFTSV